MSTPDISAEMFVGAAGCASGSQTCSGITPALTPKPRKKSANSPSRSGPDTDVPRQDRREGQGAGRGRQRQEPGDQAAGADVRHDQVQVGGAAVGALLVLGRRRAPPSTSVNSSHANRKAMTSSAANTISSAPSSRLKPTPTKTDRRLEMGLPDVSDAEDRDRHGQHRQDRQEPRRQPVHRVRQHEAGCLMDQPHAVQGGTRAQDVGGRQERRDGREAGAEECDLARDARPPRDQQRRGDRADAERERRGQAVRSRHGRATRRASRCSSFSIDRVSTRRLLKIWRATDSSLVTSGSLSA